MNYEWGFSDLLPYWPELLAGAWLTLKLSAWATVLGFALGTASAVARHSGPHWLKTLVGCYVEIIRNTPLLVQVFLVYFGIASLGVHVNANMAAVLALVVNVGAYTCEIVRAGIDSVQRSQIEAGECLGLSWRQVYRHIVIAPAIERVYPALAGQYVMLMLRLQHYLSNFGQELTAVANRVQSDTFRAFETYIVAGLVYLLLSFIVRLIFWGFGQLLFPRRRRLGTSL